MSNPADEILGSDSGYLSVPSTRTQTMSYFILAVLGFSFWFFMAVPFASHRESYWWLAMVHSKPFTDILGFVSVTYRPMAQAMTWLGFFILNPSIFPTSVLRQAILQGFIYAMFVVSWGLIYSATSQRRLFALVAFVAGGVFFSGYVHLFHIYGIFYVPVMLSLGTLLHFQSAGTLGKREVWVAAVATLLVFWHPFATALFLGFYFGFYLDTFWQRSRREHLKAGIILLVGMMAVAALVLSGPRTEYMTLNSRLLGFLVSYKTNEINLIASFVAFLMAQMVVFSMAISRRLKLAAVLFVSILGVLFLLRGLPILLLLAFVVLMKLLYLRSWSLFFLMLAATLLPLGKGSGSPVYGLFSIILAVYVTPLGWVKVEKALIFLKSRYVMAVGLALFAVLLLVRMGIDVPIVTKVASPLLAERERTYQLEYILAWLHNSDYCAYEIAFAEKAGNPIDSVESAISRWNRPPAGIEDVEVFWKDVLQCQKAERPKNKAGTAIVTFGGPALAGLKAVFEVEGRYAGTATVWIEDSQTK